MKKQENSINELVLMYQPFYNKLSQGFKIYFEDLSNGKLASSTLAKKIGELLLVKLLPLQRYEQLSNQPISAEQKQKLFFNKEQISKVSPEFIKEFIIDSINEDQNIFDLEWFDETNPSDGRIANYFRFTEDELLKLLNNYLSYINGFDQGARDFKKIQEIVQKNQNSDDEIINKADTDMLYIIFSKYNIFLSHQEIASLFILEFSHSLSKDEQNFMLSIDNFYNTVICQNTYRVDTDKNIELTKNLVENSFKVYNEHLTTPKLNDFASEIIAKFTEVVIEDNNQVKDSENEQKLPCEKDADLAIAMAMSLEEDNSNQNDNEMELIGN